MLKPFYRLVYWNHRLASGLWHWGWRRFTLPGLCLLGGSMVAAITGVDIENTVIYQSLGLLLALLLLAWAGSFLSLTRFSVSRRLPRFGTVGQPLRYGVTIKNQTARTQTGLTLLEDLADPRPAFPEWLAFQQAESRRVRPFRMIERRRKNPFLRATVKPASVPPLPPRGEVEVPVEILPLRRGILRFTGATLAHPDPLGLFCGLATVAAPQTVLILPKRYSLPPLALPGALRYQEGGVSLAANVGRSEEFVSLRDYRHGDPLRHIHWRSWAKVGKPIVKEFEDEFFVRHALILDTFDEDPNSDVLEEAVSVAASFACTVLTQESLLDLLFVGNQSYCFTAGRGLGNADQMLEILASVQNCADRKFAALEQLVLGHAAVVSGCICVFQRWDEPRRNLVEKLRRLGVPLRVMVIVPAVGRISGAGGVPPDESGTVHVLEVGKIQETLAQLK